MRYIAFLAAFVFCALPVAAKAELPRLSVKGNGLQTSDGKPITLRGVSLCSVDWHNPLSLIEQASGKNSDWNVNVLRLPVQAKEWKKTDPDKYLRERLDPAVRACKKNNVYCIIDWHDIARWDDSEAEAALRSFWDRAAPRYAPEKHILYEIFNEPTEPKARNRENWLAWREKAQKWVDLIQHKAPHTVLLVGSPHWSQMPSFAVADPFRGKNIVYTMHLYPNFKQKQWDSLFGKAAETVPVFISEWGWTSKEGSFYVIKGTKEDYARPLRDYLDARPHIGWTAWSFDPKCGPAMLGQDKEMGGFVKSWLRKSSPSFQDKPGGR